MIEMCVSIGETTASHKEQALCLISVANRDIVIGLGHISFWWIPERYMYSYGELIVRTNCIKLALYILMGLRFDVHILYITSGSVLFPKNWY
jgi:hypothetical protein